MEIIPHHSSYHPIGIIPFYFRLNQWKRTRGQLQRALQERDINSVEEFMKRFKEMSMKDDNGVYQRSEDFLNNRKDSKLNMRNAGDVRNEAQLVSSIAGFE